MDESRIFHITRRRFLTGVVGLGLAGFTGVVFRNSEALSQSSLRWLEPQGGTTVSGNVTLRVEPPNGTSRVLFYANNNWIGTAGSSPWQIELDTTGYPDGEMTLRASARDDDSGGLLDRQDIIVTIARAPAEEPDEDQNASDEEPEVSDAPSEEPEVSDAPSDEPEVSDAPSIEAAYEITTGTILNDHYETTEYTGHWLYGRVNGGDWQPTYSGPEWHGDARGLLMNIRSVHAWFEDLTGNIESFMPNFDPDANVDAFIAELDDYRRHGVLGVAINLQGGNLGYPGAGWDNTAFNDDGTLKSGYMARVDKVLSALNERHMTCILGFFYRPDRSGAPDPPTDESFRNAVDQATEWIANSGWRNIIIEIANEHNHSGGFGGTMVATSDGISELMNRSRDKLRNEHGIWTVPVSTSRTGGLEWPASVGANADLALPHANNVSDPGSYPRLIASIQSDFDYPVICNEDDLSGGTTFTPATLESEKDALDAFFDSGSSWGLMHKAWNQYAASAGGGNPDTPVRHALGGTADLSVSDQVVLEDNYAKAVLLHYAARTTAEGTPLSATG